MESNPGQVLWVVDLDQAIGCVEWHPFCSDFIESEANFLETASVGLITC
jgi:hypothetical protein